MMFTSPDTLIPDPYHPLDWNRYSYARYNPIRYTDPTGHAVACETGDICNHFSKPDPNLAVFEDYSGKWEDYPELQDIIETKLKSLGGRLASVINKEQSILYKMGELTGKLKRSSPIEAFLLVFGGPVKFIMMANMETYAAERNYQGGINIYLPTWIENHSDIIYHEIGHHIENIFGVKTLALPDNLDREANDYGKVPEYNGFFGGKYIGQFSLPAQTGFDYETLADMFLGWSVNRWSQSELGSERRKYMDDLIIDLIQPILQ